MDADALFQVKLLSNTGSFEYQQSFLIYSHSSSCFPAYQATSQMLSNNPVIHLKAYSALFHSLMAFIKPQCETTGYNLKAQFFHPVGMQPAG